MLTTMTKEDGGLLQRYLSVSLTARPRLRLALYEKTALNYGSFVALALGLS
jgi:hypothetical protein